MFDIEDQAEPALRSMIGTARGPHHLKQWLAITV